MDITIVNGKVRCEPRPMTLEDSRDKIQACVVHGDRQGLKREREWLVKKHGPYINKIIDEWIRDQLYE